jgi:hypothetical protein
MTANNDPLGVEFCFAENSIPEKMDYRKITVRVPVMDKMQLLFASEPSKLLKSRSL